MILIVIASSTAGISGGARAPRERDFSPTVPLSRLFTTLCVFLGLGIVAGLIGLVGEVIIEDSKQRAKDASQQE